ncbi:hypothetical protein SESBI_43640, partial [Sesbania bispinosa]
ANQSPLPTLLTKTYEIVVNLLLSPPHQVVKTDMVVDTRESANVTMEVRFS